MLAGEREKLLALFDSDRRWCQDAEARDVSGRPVKFHDPGANSWDITGAICCLFGWKRACDLFGQLERHIHKRRRILAFNRNEAIDSMLTLQAYNDRPETTFEVIHTLVKTMPVRTDMPGASNAHAAPVVSQGIKQADGEACSL